MIKFCNVSFCYGEEDAKGGTDACIDGMSFEIRAGECVVLCGRSGAGKSTVLRLIDGLAPAFYEGTLHGSVTVAGREPAAMTPEQRVRTFGVVFQDPRSQFFMNSVQDEIAFSAENIGLDPRVVQEKVQEAASLLDIEPLLCRTVDALSAGQKQRVAIAAALVLSPDILILDEPVSNLDAEGSRILIELLAKIKRRGTTIVISEHRLHAFLGVADSFLHIEHGRVAHRWTAAEFARLPEDELRRFGFRYPGMAELPLRHKKIRAVERAVGAAGRTAEVTAVTGAAAASTGTMSPAAETVGTPLGALAAGVAGAAAASIIATASTETVRTAVEAAKAMTALTKKTTVSTKPVRTVVPMETATGQTAVLAEETATAAIKATEKTAKAAAGTAGAKAAAESPEPAEKAQEEKLPALCTSNVTYLYRPVRDGVNECGEKNAVGPEPACGIRNISLAFPHGSVTALTGENGAGKTTLCKVLCGLLRQKSGSITLDGRELSCAQRQRISYFVMQDADYQLYSDSVINELLLGREPSQDNKRHTEEALELFRLQEVRNRHPASLSGGEKQRVVIAAAYCSDAEVFVFDEPTSGMDGEGLLSMARWADMLAQAGKTVIIITHDELLADIACDYRVRLIR